jgi:hypothetical protein
MIGRRAELAAVAELQRDLPYVVAVHRPEVALACWYRAVEDLDRSRTALNAVIADSRDRGEEAQLAPLCWHLTQTEIWAGRYPVAQRAIDEGWRQWSRTAGAPALLKTAEVLLRLLTDDLAGARAGIAELGDDRAYPDVDPIAISHLQGVAALLQGDSEQAADHLWTAYLRARESGKHDTGRRHRLESDLGSALVNAGRLDEATGLAGELIAHGEHTGRPTVLGLGLRIQGLALSGQGDQEACAETL